MHPWEQLKDMCILIDTDTKSWHDAKLYCQEKNADLLFVNNQREQIAIESKFFFNFYFLWPELNSGLQLNSKLVQMRSR
jgi:hypothetical protein